MDNIHIKNIEGEELDIPVYSLQDVSDGYHTIDEMYSHRYLLFILLCTYLKGRVYYKLDSSNPGWFILYLETRHGQISYHITEHYLYAIQSFAILDADHQWDGHTSAEVLARLQRLIEDVIAPIPPKTSTTEITEIS